NLPGFGKIASTTSQALQINPEQVMLIAQVALKDFSMARDSVLAGDRTQGGHPSQELMSLSEDMDLEGFEFVSDGFTHRDCVEQRSSNVSKIQSLPVPETDQVVANTFDVFEFDSEDLSELDTDVMQGMDEDPFDMLLEEDVSLNDVDQETNLTLDDDIDFPTLVQTESTSNAENSVNRSVDSPQEEETYIEFEDVFDLDESISTSSTENQAGLDVFDFIDDSSIEEADARSANVPSTESSLIKSDKSFPISSSQRSSPSAKGAIANANQQTPPQRTKNIRVDLTQLHQLEHLSGELLIQQTKQGAKGDELHELIRQIQSQLKAHLTTLHDLQDELETVQLSQVKKQLSSVSSPSKVPSPSTLDSCEPDVFGFDDLEMDNYSHQQALAQTAIDQVYRLETMMTSVAQISKHSRHVAKLQRRLLTNVQDQITATRMQSLGVLMQRFPRIIEQLKSSYGKQVELIIKGTDVLVDRVMVEKLYDPLLHVIRNAFDHGIESADERTRYGKLPIGRIEIRAFNQGSSTVIEVSDDGRGIDVEKVGQRAIALGLTTAQQLASIPQSDLFNFLFYPGFTTVTQVSDLSGRGVGLDVVRAQLQDIQGNVTVHSLPHQGTTFQLRLPFSLRVASLLLCDIEDTLYAFPVDSGERVFLAKPEQFYRSADQTLTLVLPSDKQEVIRVYRMSDFLTYSTSHEVLKGLTRANDMKDSLRTLQFHSDSTNLSQPVPVLLIRTTEGLRGLLIDRVRGEHELVIRPLSPMIPSPPSIHGCCILGDSQLALVIDAVALLQQRTSAQTGSLPKAPQLGSSNMTAKPINVLPSSTRNRLIPDPQPQPRHSQTHHSQAHHSQASQSTEALPVLMIVDDSATVRHTLATTLKQAGYHVIQASDGLEAIALLENLPTLAAVICDIEMPRCNGFQFLDQTRRNPIFSRIPVVLLTSRQSKKHQQIAMELGASAYVTKPYNSHDLLAIINQVVGDRPLLAAAP
ncbi:MAG: response regulator, partial [Leptolyngbyaceae bacterium]|nr:response regulator [Leptolyngbyaceae bacterium]